MRVSAKRPWRASSGTRSRYARFEADSLADVGLEDLCVSAAVLGMEVSVGLHPFEDAVRDVGQPRLGKWLARRLREHERDGGVDVILLVLSDSAINGRLLPNLLEVLGPAWRTAARDSAGIACRRAAAWFRRHPVVARAASQ